MNDQADNVTEQCRYLFDCAESGFLLGWREAATEDYLAAVDLLPYVPAPLDFLELYTKQEFILSTYLLPTINLE